METLAPKISKASPATLRRLSRSGGEGKFITLYIDLDPAEFATPSARQSQLNSLINSARKQVGSMKDLEHEELASLRADLERAEAYLAPEGEWAEDAGAVAVFCSDARGVFEVVKIAGHVEQGFHIGDTPMLDPLIEVSGGDLWCVALVDRRNARIFMGTPATLREVGSFEDSVPGQHDQGGWSQGRYERSIENEVDAHMGNLAQQLFDAFERKPFDHLAIACLEENYPRAVDELHEYVKDKLVGRLELDVQNAGIDEVRERVQEMAKEVDEQFERGLLDRLQQELGTAGRAVKGFHDVVGATNEAKIETLLLLDAFHAPGVACPKCDWVGTEGTTCPLDSERLELHEDLVPKLIELCLNKSGSVRTVRHFPLEIEGKEAIAALTRF